MPSNAPSRLGRSDAMTAVWRRLWNKAKARGVAGTARATHKEIARAIQKLPFGAGTNSYLKQITGVIHVGANLGQERELYAKYKLKVLWIEPLPDIFERLCENISPFPDQTAVNHLVTDKDNAEYLFHIASNE